MKEDTKKTLKESLKDLKLKDVIYPIISVIFLATILLMFYSSTKFITKNVNKIFYSGTTNETSQALDFNHYQLVAKKLHINIASDKETSAVSEVTTSTVVIAPTEASTSTPAIAPLDKQAVSIIVKNSTPKKGGATALAKEIEDAGFKKPLTGNEPKLYATTTIMVNDSKKDYAQLLLEVVRKTHPEALSTTTPKTEGVDIIVIIGTH